MSQSVFSPRMTNSWPAGHLWPSGPIWVALEISSGKKLISKKKKKIQICLDLHHLHVIFSNFRGRTPDPLLRLRTLKYALLCSAFYEQLGLLFMKSQILDRFIVFSI